MSPATPAPNRKTATDKPAARDSANEIATVRIELCDTEPLIWRQVEVPTSITLKVLHDIVQITMGWLDYHLWEFTVAGQRYGLPMDEASGSSWGTAPRKEASKVRLRDVLHAHSVERDRPFRPIVITDSGDRDHVRAPVEQVLARGMMR